MIERYNSNLIFIIIASIIFSGLCWYLSLGLSGNFWYLLWVAPVPILILSNKLSLRATVLVSFAAYLIGRLSWFGYLVTVATLIPAIILTIALPLIFVVIVIFSRATVTKTNSGFGLFAFPVFFTFFEFLLITFSPDGSAASIAYSQSDFLPMIQIASVTGILGITFIVCLIPSALAVGWHYRREKNKLVSLAIVSLILVSAVLIGGIIRISSYSEGKKISVGLVVLDEKSHRMDELDFQAEVHHTESYANEIANLSAQGAKIVVLPERAVNLNEENRVESIRILSNIAKNSNTVIVAGYTNFTKNEQRNSALVINSQGNIVLDYDKVHLVTGLEDQFRRGNKIGLFDFEATPAGIAICKDLDFPEFIKEYGQMKAGVVFVPAWDFVTDAWLHSRMAVLRGVENGFSEVRTARQGQLTISDYLGRVTSEADSSNGQPTALTGQVLLERKNTIYSQSGNWFGIIITITAIVFLLAVARNMMNPKKDGELLK